MVLITGVDENVKEIMQNIKLPDKEIKKLIRNKKNSPEKLSDNLKLLINEADNLEKTSYPDKEFNELAKQLNVKLQKTLELLDQKQNLKVIKSWKEVKSICYECHNKYR